MTTPELMIEARDLRRSFTTKEAVAGISFTTRKGEIFGLLGPNGAGKTTTIHMLTGQIEPSGGSVDITKAGSGGEYDLERESAIRQDSTTNRGLGADAHKGRPYISAFPDPTRGWNHLTEALANCLEKR